ncbi:PLATZ transcription factor family protein [Striga asiatica]|uniref:PLATZ transcription factor family protein n=1 Tax=Striga asiatica TaxID=4170 RepID=A0A5A7QIA3_STRAF|nr:PLATZ transcription factor family protein [Striga asiatica]
MNAAILMKSPFSGPTNDKQSTAHSKHGMLALTLHRCQSPILGSNNWFVQCNFYLFKELLVELIGNSRRGDNGDREKRKREDEGKYVAAGAGTRTSHHRNSSRARFPAANLQNWPDCAALYRRLRCWLLVGGGDKARNSESRE